MKVSLTLLAALAVLSCKADESAPTDKAPAPAPPSTETAAVPDEPADKPPQDPAAATKQAMCESRCGLLTSHSLADLEGGGHEKMCGQPLIAGDGCDQFDRMRNCIFAVHGYTFKKKKWQDEFKKEPWYTTHPDLKDEDFSKLERDNIKALKARAKACRTQPGKALSSEDLAFARQWLVKRPLPAVLYTEGFGRIEKQVHFAARVNDFKVDATTTFRYVDQPSAEDVADELKNMKLRVIHIGRNIECNDPEDEFCEPYEEWIELLVKADATGADKLYAVLLPVAAG